VAAQTELAGVVGRGAMRLVDEHARTKRCRVAVFGADGTPLVAGAENEIGPGAVAGPAAAVPVVAYDRVLGFVVARADPTAGEEDSVRGVAAHGAALLSELCAREYELNDLSREILGSYEELNLFYDLGAELAGAPDAESACRLVLAKARRVLGARRGRVLLADVERGVFRCAASDAASEEGGLSAIDEGRAGAAFASRSPETIDDVRTFASPRISDFERATRTLVTVPLRIGSAAGAEHPSLGVLQLADKESGEPFSASDLKLVLAIAGQAAALIHNARLIGIERELRIARTIQQRLLPSAPPNVAGLDVAGTCVPARNVGGDFYDHVASGATSLSFVVADVSGHDLAAALLQTQARAAFRTAATTDSRPVEVIRRAGLALREDLSRAEMFLTAWFGRIDAATGAMTYCDAGHNPAVHFSAATGMTSLLGTSGIPIGVGEDEELEEREVHVGEGDVVVAYTDGVTEAGGIPSPMDAYGEIRLAEAVTRSAELSAAQIARAVLDDVAAFAGEGENGDDRTIVVVKRVAIARPAEDSQAERGARSMREAHAAPPRRGRRSACRKRS